MNSTIALARLTPYQNVPSARLDAAEDFLRDRDFKEGEVVFKLKPSAALSEDYSLVQLDSFSLEKVDEQPIVRAKLPQGVGVKEALAALRSDPAVEYAEPNAVYRLPDFTRSNIPGGGLQESAEPNDLDRRLWGLKNTGRRGGTEGADINAVEAWKTTIGDKKYGPLIAVIDTGIDYKHPDLADNMWINPGEVPNDGIDNDGNGVIDDVHGYNAFAQTGDPMDDHSHGTHCAGTIAAVGNNGHGIVGVNWEANLMAVKIFDSRGNTSLDAILRGLDYAAKMGADITNNSWGDSAPSEAIKDAFGRMDETVHFAAAGNNRNNNDYRNYYPCGHDLPNIVAVAASDRNDKKPVFSNYGLKTVHVAAPGDEILSTVTDGSYGVYSGTSMASPHAAGVAGLLLTEFPELTPQQVKERLIYNSDAVPALSRASQSRGRINAARTLETDEANPASPNDFRAKSANSNGTTLNWTTTGDDGWCGDAPSDVELWVSDQPITAENLNSATRLETERPQETGQVAEYHYQTEHSADDRVFHFAMRFVDNVGNRSELRTTSAAISAAQTVFRSEFGPDDGFEGEGEWARVQDPERGWVWTDSPDGPYDNASNASLVSPLISLKGKAQSILLLDAKHDIQQKDKAVVEVGTSDGEWHGVGTYHARRQNWGERKFDLSQFDGQDVRVRVRMESDPRFNKDGIYVDNFRVVADEI